MTATIWVIDDDHSIRCLLHNALGQEGYQPVRFEVAGAALYRPPAA